MLRLLARGVRCYHTEQCFGYRRKPSLQTSHGSPDKARAAQANLWRLASAHHTTGHRTASLDPLGVNIPTPHPSLLPHTYGLADDDIVQTSDILFSFPASSGSVAEVVGYLRDMYCGHISLDVSAVTDETEREWLIRHYETSRNSPLTPEQQQRMAHLMLSSQSFDLFMSKRFPSVKRYGCEGAESMLVFFDWLFKGAEGVRDVVLCMPHRGRLNLLTSLLGLSPTALFHKLQGNADFPIGAPCTGDVASHLVSSVDLPGPLHVTLLPNPSHLEAVNPVAMGKARARQLSHSTGPYSPPITYTPSQVLTVQVHGDASFAAQGIVMESFALNNHPHFDPGGSVHLIVNNQLGFTTEPVRGCESCDIGRMIGAPVLHVNGAYPEEVARAASIALEYRRCFEKDIIVNMVCFRRWGHNELDNPSLTQPTMYQVIESRPTIPDQYTATLHESGVLSCEDSERITAEAHAHLQECLTLTPSHTPQRCQLLGVWKNMVDAPSTHSHWDTGLPADLLQFVGVQSVHTPEWLTPHPRLVSSHVTERCRRLADGGIIDWSTAEACAIGSLLLQGYNVRLSGQDVGRGTFSHRHMMIVDQNTEEAFIPLNHFSPEQPAFLEVANSPLSEEAVLGFEYGFSIESPYHLVLWEAQFGDFYNGAQSIIDTFVASGESKWLLQSGLVLLLPHGFDGAGPDHSSAHVERFLQLCDSSESGGDGDHGNLQVVHPTTPAQYYHLLRRQMVRNFRKPLIVQSPKTLLRLPAAVSSLTDMGPGTTFNPVLSDSSVDPSNVRRVVLCSGKHYYTLDQYRRDTGVSDTAIIRLELISPFPARALSQELAKYRNANVYVWSQEEPENMGPWSFVAPRVRKQLGLELSLVSRGVCASTAVGVAKVHAQEAKKLLTDTFPN